MGTLNQERDVPKEAPPIIVALSDLEGRVKVPARGGRKLGGEFESRAQSIDAVQYPGCRAWQGRAGARAQERDRGTTRSGRDRASHPHHADSRPSRSRRAVARAMDLEDDGSQQYAEYRAPSHFERRLDLYREGRRRKRFVSEFAKDDAAMRKARAVLNRQRFAARRLAKILPDPSAMAVLVARAVVDEELKRWPTECSPEIYEYCAYVRVLITSRAVASALGLTQHRVANALSQLAREGLIRKVGRTLYMRRKEGAPSFVWEWIGP